LPICLKQKSSVNLLRRRAPQSKRIVAGKRASAQNPARCSFHATIARPFPEIAARDASNLTLGYLPFSATFSGAEESITRSKEGGGKELAFAFSETMVDLFSCLISGTWRGLRRNGRNATGGQASASCNPLETLKTEQNIFGEIWKSFEIPWPSRFCDAIKSKACRYLHHNTGNI
jgi:hypothetical protein